MTPDEKKDQMTARNAAICAYYANGATLAQTASRFQLGRQRVAQILQAGGVWRPYVKNGRTKFLGVTVSEETKDALKAKADANGVSVSKFTSDVLAAAVKE